MKQIRRFLRGLGLGVALALALLVAWAVPPVAARANSLAATDSLDNIDLLLFPAAPCTTDTVTVFVRGFVATPCDSFIGAEKTSPNGLVIRTQIHAGRACLVGPTQFFSVPVVMGRFPAGSNTIDVSREVVIVDAGPPDTLRTSEPLTFEVSATCQPPAPIPAEKLPFVVQVVTVPSPPCPGQPALLHLAGVFRDGCGMVSSVDPSSFSLTIAPYPPIPSPCTLALKPWSVDFPLGSMAPGHFRVTIHMTVLGSDTAWPPIPTQAFEGVFDFDVPALCAGALPLPYVDFVRVLSGHSCGLADSTVCAGDSIRVLMGGKFPNSCYHVAKIELVDLPYASPIPMPPMIRLYVADQGCTLVPCSAGPVPWNESVTLAPLIARDYGLIVQEVRVFGCPPAPADTTQIVVPFHVVPADQCPSRPCACLTPSWLTPSNGGECTAIVSPGGSAAVTLGIQSSVALAGLQGSLRVAGGTGFRISDLEAVGSAEGMHLSWVPTADGARFVMFADQGAPIPPSDRWIALPVLRVTAELAPGSTDPRYFVTPVDLLGSDIDGNQVPTCPPPPNAFLLPPTAVFCLDRGQCDFNADGQVDVRDLVRMVHCVLGDGPCPPDANTRFDCDADSTFDLSDVICCAMAILRAPGCPDCPVDSVRSEPNVGLDFGAPVTTATGLDLPLRLRGQDLVGAARIRLRFPVDRFYVTGVDAPGVASLHDVENDELVVGLIGPFAIVKPMLYPTRPPDIVVHLALRQGQLAGGQAIVVAGEFSGPDGVKLGVPLGQPTVILGAGGAGVLLSRPTPNPFSTEARFSVALDRAGPLDVGVYDLAGRRVATLFHGTAAAGTHPFTWNGSADDGRPARGGMYFCRATANGVTATRRMVMLSGR